MAKKEREERVEKLIGVARSLIGAPYKYGACAEEYKYINGKMFFDCSLFIQYIFKQIGVELPRSTILQAAAPGKEISGKRGDEVAIGDVAFYEGERGHYRHDLFPDKKIYIGHAVICTDASGIIHACNNSIYSGVVEHSIIHLPDYYNPIVLIKRFIV
ncbi:MAG: NlpC/P60 family protein [Patescibacteria group bacterium]